MSVGAFGQRLLAIAGSFPEGTFTVERLNGRETLGQCFAYDLTLLSDSPTFDISTLIGDTVTLTIDRGENEPRHVHGYVTRAGMLGTFDRHARYSVHVVPWFFLLSGRVNNKVFHKQSVPDIAKALFREHGFADFEDHLSGEYPQREFVVQHRESDFAFVSRLLEKVGIYYFFRHEKGRHVLMLADAGSAHKTVRGSETIPFHPEGSSTPTSAEQLNRWETQMRWRSKTVTSSDFDFERPKADLTARVHASLPFKQADLEVFDYPAGYAEQPQVDSFVKSRLTGLLGDTDTRRASGDVQGLNAGDLFTLSDFPSDDQNKQYLIVDAWFDAVNNAHQTGDSGGGGYFHSVFTLLTAVHTFRPPMATVIPRVEGPQTAIVVGEDGEEITTDKYGRVKVQFHWDREGKRNQDSSCWVRVAQVWAGSGWGAMHIPRIGQEVIVEFLDGDPDRPIITGRVYNADNMPPYTLPDNKTQSGIKSRSTKGAGPANFNEIRFEDKKGSEELHIQAEKDQTSTVKNDQAISVGAARSLSVGTDETISITANQNLTVGANRSKTIAANETVTIGGASTETIAAARAVTIGAAYQISVGGILNETVAGARTEEVGAAKSVNVAGASSVNVGGSSSENVGGDKSLTGKGNVTINAGTNLSAAAGKNALIEAAEQMTLKCGDATITLKKNGDISIKGKNISLDASGNLVQKGSKIGHN